MYCLMGEIALPLIDAILNDIGINLAFHEMAWRFVKRYVRENVGGLLRTYVISADGRKQKCIGNSFQISMSRKLVSGYGIEHDRIVICGLLSFGGVLCNVHANLSHPESDGNVHVSTPAWKTVTIEFVEIGIIGGRIDLEIHYLSLCIISEDCSFVLFEGLRKVKPAPLLTIRLHPQTITRRTSSVFLSYVNQIKRSCSKSCMSSIGLEQGCTCWSTCQKKFTGLSSGCMAGFQLLTN